MQEVATDASDVRGATPKGQARQGRSTPAPSVPVDLTGPGTK